MSGVTGSGAGLAQTGERIPGVVGTFPAAAPAGAAAEPQPVNTQQVGDRQTAGDSQAEQPPTLNQWREFQATKDREIQQARQEAEAERQRVKELEHSHSQTTLQHRVQSRASEIFAFNLSQNPQVDQAALERWAIQTAQDEIAQEREREANERDAKQYRTQTLQQRQETAAKDYAKQVIQEYGLTPQQFRDAMREGEPVPADHADFKTLVLKRVVAFRDKQQALERHNQASTLVNSTAFPGASAGGGELEFNPNRASRGKPSYGKALDDGWKRLRS